MAPARRGAGAREDDSQTSDGEFEQDLKGMGLSCMDWEAGVHADDEVGYCDSIPDDESDDYDSDYSDLDLRPFSEIATGSSIPVLFAV